MKFWYDFGFSHFSMLETTMNNPQRERHSMFMLKAVTCILWVIIFLLFYIVMSNERKINSYWIYSPSHKQFVHSVLILIAVNRFIYHPIRNQSICCRHNIQNVCAVRKWFKKLYERTPSGFQLPLMNDLNWKWWIESDIQFLLSLFFILLFFSRHLKQHWAMHKQFMNILIAAVDALVSIFVTFNRLTKVHLRVHFKYPHNDVPSHFPHLI